jgi:hypothetical protein
MNLLLCGTIVILIGVLICLGAIRRNSLNKAVEEEKTEMKETKVEKVKIHEEFHIKVSPFTADGDYYCIEFTNNNWLTSERLMDICRIWEKRKSV